jgi:protein-L-isoaspartate O-methyltransferase
MIQIIVTPLGIENVVIDNGDGSFTSMTKATYDTLASELSNPSTPQAGE